MGLRYMGTKRALAPTVSNAIVGLGRRGQVADLFSGMGSVATSMAPTAPVLTNDALTFTTAFARSRFLPTDRMPIQDVTRRLFPNFSVAYEILRDDFGVRMKREQKALSDRHKLADFMETAPHAGNSNWYRRHARQAAASCSIKRYRLATLYFSGGYFSTVQAAQLDALRYAIDQLSDDAISRDWLMAAWLGAAAVVVNAPGHTAQFLKPGNEAVYKRIRRQWERPVWSIFVEQLDAIQPVGTKKWRAKNRVCSGDALALVDSSDFDDVTVVYADPPYTKDQYSRFYHVYETLFCYDFPSSKGIGRYRPDRFRTPFSLVRDVKMAFKKLFVEVAIRSLPLVLSYPDNGLLHYSGTSITTLLEEHFSIRESHYVTLQHSTLGASSGAHTKSALEGVYVCVP